MNKFLKTTMIEQENLFSIIVDNTRKNNLNNILELYDVIYETQSDYSVVDLIVDENDSTIYKAIMLKDRNAANNLYTLVKDLLVDYSL